MKQTKDYTILAVGIVILLAVIASSCSSQKRYYSEGTNLTPTNLAKYYKQCDLKAVKRTKMGFKHTFVAGEDTLIRYYNLALPVDSCYYVWKTKTDK